MLLALLSAAATVPAAAWDATAEGDLRGLRLTLESAQKELLVGQAAKFNVTWEAVAPVRRVRLETPDFDMYSLGLLVDDRRETRLYRESTRPNGCGIFAATSLMPGQRHEAEYVFYRGRLTAGGKPRGEFAFPAAGSYSVAAVYLMGVSSDAMRPTGIVSNWIRIRVKEPTGGDAAVLALMGSRATAPRFGGIHEDLDVLRSLLQQYPQSPYLRLARLEDFRLRAPVGQTIPGGGEQALRECRQLLDEVWAVKDWGPFQPEALALASRFASCVGERSLADRYRSELTRRYPHSAAAKGAW